MSLEATTKRSIVLNALPLSDIAERAPSNSPSSPHVLWFQGAESTLRSGGVFAPQSGGCYQCLGIDVLRKVCVIRIKSCGIPEKVEEKNPLEDDSKAQVKTQASKVRKALSQRDSSYGFLSVSRRQQDGQIIKCGEGNKFILHPGRLPVDWQKYQYALILQSRNDSLRTSDDLGFRYAKPNGTIILELQEEEVSEGCVLSTSTQAGNGVSKEVSIPGQSDTAPRVQLSSASEPTSTGFGSVPTVPLSAGNPSILSPHALILSTDDPSKQTDAMTQPTHPLPQVQTGVSQTVARTPSLGEKCCVML